MSATFQELHIDQLAIHPKNVRKDVGIVTDLANSISAQGILQPLVVAPDLTQRPAGKISREEVRYVIIAGHRRHAAAKLANVDSLPCVIRTDIDTEPKQLEAMLVENTQRTDLTITEEANAYQALLEFDGYTVKSVAKATGRSQSLVRSRIALTKLSEDAKDKIEDRTLNIDQALELVDYTDDEAATKRLLRVADKPNEWAFQLAKEAKTKAWLENLPRLTAELQGAGVDIIERPAGQTWEWTDWRVSYSEMTVAEAVAGSWSAICDETKDEITWLKKREKGTTYTAPQRTPEQIAADIRAQELTRGLATAAEVRSAFLKNAIETPAADQTKTLLLDFITDRLSLGDLAPWLDIDHESIDEQEVVDAIARLNIPQLVALMHVDAFEREMYMTDLAAWSDSASRWASTDTWRERLQNIYGYQWTEAEQAALDHHQALREAENANEDQEEEHEDD
ncbi:ParB/RepB/Spo0J family partition protein [Arthrobacter sp. ISL-72]|uniref:ParB/RepB/Spo0J family partition protein n=1 Tax=Arthrobacter sp. ISL-72 TaxID=2819114 RepID=UPI001BEC8878|nr:ParB/RepB/Spo0J family partition protein [Arthrobacter sp. ISL-72]MBT2594754.1 ParB/RepB/Spo0J family partition protein [Arthrobacter sp. ISL-72]